MRGENHSRRTWRLQEKVSEKHFSLQSTTTNICTCLRVGFIIFRLYICVQYVSVGIDFFFFRFSLPRSENEGEQVGGGEESAVKCTHICIDQYKMRCVYTLVPLDV